MTSLNLIILQKVFNGLDTDNQRKNSKKVLVDMLEKEMDAVLLTKTLKNLLIQLFQKKKRKSDVY